MVEGVDVSMLLDDKALAGLNELEEGGVPPLKHEGWRVIESLVDSGAARSVCPLDFCPEFKMTTSDKSRQGQHFRTASGTLVPNEGERVVSGYSDSGAALAMRYAVADIAAPLDSVSQICDAGGIVLFTKRKITAAEA